MRLKDFKYGNYCGAGHPTYTSSKPNTPERLAELKKRWNPIDDIDVLCYAHDICYELTGANNATCDEALLQTALHQNYTFEKESGCSNLARAITSGIGVKVVGTEADKKAARTNNVVKMVASIPASLAYFGINARELRQFGLPEEDHKCFGRDNGKISPLYYITYFEGRYIGSAKSFESITGTETGEAEVKIDYKGRGTQDPFLISQIQQYLTKYNFDVGPADGILGKRTKDAFEAYLEGTHADKLTDDGTPNHAVLAHMRHSWKFVGIASRWMNKKLDSTE